MKPSVLILLAIAASSPLAHAALVAHYQFENNFNDSSAVSGSQNLTGQGGAGFSASVPPNNGGSNSLDLTGSPQYASVADEAALDITGALTLAAWVNLDTANAGGVIAKFLGSGNQRSYNLRIADGGNGNAVARLLISPDGTIGAAGTVESGAFSLNQWTHIAATFSPGSAMRIYINGAESNSLTTGVPGGIYSGNAELWIGAQFATDNTSNFLDGRIDDARIYNEVLDANAIAALAVPEPSAALLGLAGLSGIFLRRRR